jgi:hypothetical protein
MFDRRLLPPALFEFIVVSDTHYILNPEPYAVEFGSVREWPERVERALKLAAGLEAEFAVHLGDLTEENPAKPEHRQAREQALEQIRRSGLEPFHVPGNMDIGDKPDATMFADWVSQETLAIYHRQLGPSWYSFDRHNVHFIVLNSQIMNGPLPAADEQAAWLESDLQANRGKRIFLFMHLPPFFVDRNEPDRGFYNSLDEPARDWLLELLAAFDVESVFCGHTHFRVFNRQGDTTLRVCASTTTSRAGFYEAFSVCPPEEQGRNDRAKLGFYLVRIYEKDCSAHFIRTELAGPDAADETRLLTLNSQEMESPIGVYLRRPLAHLDEGSVAWPSALRQRVRDDHPFLACTEAGIGHVRVPASDLSNPLQRERLQLLRQEGVSITAFWLWREELRLRQLVQPHTEILDVIEVQITGDLWPSEGCLRALGDSRDALGKEIVLTPYLAREVRPGKYHPRARIGYRSAELPQLDEHLRAHHLELDRALCHAEDGGSPLNAAASISRLGPLSHVGGFDLVVELSGTDERMQANRTAEAIFAAAVIPESRIFLSPFVDLDRTNDVNHGLLDRLSNPRPAYYVAQSLNSLLFATKDGARRFETSRFHTTATGSYRVAGADCGPTRYLLIVAESGETSSESRRLNATDIDNVLAAADKVDLFELARSRSEPELPLLELESVLAQSDGPWLVRQQAGPGLSG